MAVPIPFFGLRLAARERSPPPFHPSDSEWPKDFPGRALTHLLIDGLPEA